MTKDPQPIYRVLRYYAIEQTAVARRLDVSRQSLSRWLRSVERCPDARRAQLADVVADLTGARFTVAELFHDHHDTEDTAHVG